jgi:PII-like signaling protein
MCRHLGEQDVAGRTVVHARPGFKAWGQVNPRTLVGARGKLLLVVTFIDSGEHVRGVLPHIPEIAPDRLIASERVALDSGEFE